ncbi:MAG: hypothetical protein WBA46_05610 [Thermomicrobiales bacterium]
MRSAAIVTRDQYGRMSVPESGDAVIGDATWGGSLIGMLIGIIGGPIGMLFGWAGGALVGGAIDVRRADRGDSLLGQISELVPTSGTALVAEVNEYATEVVDGLMVPLGGTVFRRSADSILAEMEAAEEAYDKAKDEADRVAKERRKAERKEKWDDRIASLKSKLGIK